MLFTGVQSEILYTDLQFLEMLCTYVQLRETELAFADPCHRKEAPNESRGGGNNCMQCD